MQLQPSEPEDLLCNESFQRFCLGESRHDVMIWEEWIKANPDQLELLNRAKRLFELVSAGQGSRLEQMTALKDAMDRRLRMQELITGRPVAEISSPPPARVAKLQSKFIIRYAAAVMVAAGVSVLAYLAYTRTAGASFQQYEYTTGANVRKTIVLPDNSVVMLNENSHLSVSKKFDARHRDVSIEGEAFFDIKTDAAHPFMVHTNDYNIRVLGTSFNVKAYPGKAVETGLITGKIEISADAGAGKENRLVLLPSEKFTGWHKPGPAADLKQANGGVEKLRKDSLTQYIAETSWMRRKMEINNETFEQFAHKLEEWYGIKVLITDEAVRQYRYTATFNDETIFKVLHYLQQSYPFSYKVEENTIIVTQQ